MFLSNSTFLLISVVVAATAFAPPEPPIRASKWAPKRISPPRFHRKHRGGSGARLSADSDAGEAEALREKARKLREEAAEAAGMSVEELSSAIKNNDGTVYDDEVAAPRENVSSAMKERLLREASTGLDSEKSQTNVILYISVAVALLVALGGQGILY